MFLCAIGHVSSAFPIFVCNQISGPAPRLPQQCSLAPSFKTNMHTFKQVLCRCLHSQYSSCQAGNVLKHFFYHRILRMTISSGILRSLSNVQDPESAIVEQCWEPLRSTLAENVLRTWVVHT